MRVWRKNTNFPNWERMRLIIEKEKAYYWKPVREKKVMSRRTSF